MEGTRIFRERLRNGATFDLENRKDDNGRRVRVVVSADGRPVVWTTEVDPGTDRFYVTYLGMSA